MRIRVVEVLPPLPQRGRVSRHQLLYQQLNETPAGEWVTVSCLTSADFRRLLASLRAHKTPRIRTRTDVANLVVYAQRQ